MAGLHFLGGKKVSVREEGECHSMLHVDGPKTEKVQEPTVESLVQGIRRPRASEVEWRVQEGV